MFCLAGKAKEKYQSLSIEAKNDIKEIFKALKEISVKPASHYLSMFNAKTMRPGEKSVKYCKELELLLDRAMPGLQENFKEQLLKDKVLKSVPSSLRIFFELMIDQPWNKIVSQCEKKMEYETSVDDEPEEMMINKFEQVPNFRRRDERYGHKRFESTNNKRFEGTHSKRFERTCNYCQKYGHKYHECRKRKFDMQRNKSETNSDHTPRSVRENKNQTNFNTNFKPRAFTIDAEVAEDTKETEAHTVHCESFSCSSVNKASLTRVNSTIELDRSKVDLPMLIDSGATASFINITQLPNKLANKISRFIDGDKNFSDLGLKRIDLAIKSALSSRSVICAIGTVTLRINDWIGEHEFIFTDITEKAILGMDFLKKYKAVFDFGKNSVILDDNEGKHQINYIEDKEVNFFKAPHDLIKGVVWASSICDVNEDKTIVVSVINLTEEDASFRQDMEIGEWKEAEISPGEDPEDLKLIVDG